MTIDCIMTPLLPILYFGPIEYYSIIAKSSIIEIDKHENFQKQTYRNRCSIYGANGLLNLIVPIQHKSEKKQIKDIVISYSENWQQLHWRSIKNVYQSSPYFEYYEDDIANLYLKQNKYLIDLNENIQSVVIDLLKIKPVITFSEVYIKSDINKIDYRNHFNNKTDNTEHLNTTRYIQVFEEKYGFLANLSIMDLLFNLGPSAKDYLLDQS